MIDKLKDELPLLFQVVSNGQFNRDFMDAVALLELSDPEPWERLSAAPGGARSSRLVYHLCAALRLAEGYDSTARLIERDLQTIQAADISTVQMRGAFAPKLLNDQQFDDVLYEIASAAIFGQVLDPKSCKLEEPLDGTEINPDLTGSWKGKRVRVEVKRVDDLPPRRDPEAIAIIVSAAIPGGFNVQLNTPLTKNTEAQFIKRMVEQIHAHRDVQQGGKVRVEGFDFIIGRSHFSATDLKSPIRSLGFNDIEELRSVQPGVFTGSTMSPTEEAILGEGFPIPEGVQVFGNKRVNPAALLRTSKGERVYNNVKAKLRQCEDGAINIVVLGLSAAHYNETDLADGLLGSAFILAEANPVDFEPEFVQSRTGLGPFTTGSAVDQLPAETEDRFPGLIEMIRTEISAFQKVSGVLGIRLSSSYPLAAFRSNPNAKAPAPSDAAEVLLPFARSRAGSLPPGT